MQNFKKLRVLTCASMMGAASLLMSGAITTGASATSAAVTKNPCANFPKGTISIAAFGPFSGPTAYQGEEGILPGLKVGAYEVNADGGVCGNQIASVIQDSRGDPADAIPAAYQLIQTHQLSGIIGLDSETAVATARIFNAAKIVTMTTAGATQLNRLKMKYVYRTYPPDVAAAYAVAGAALQKHENTAVVFYDNTSGDQSEVPSLIGSYSRHGGKILANMHITQDEPSYAAYVRQIVQLKPKVIFYEADLQTTGTFFSELQQSSLGLKTKVILSAATPLITAAIASATHETDTQLSTWVSETNTLSANSATYASFVNWFKLSNGGLSPFNGYNAANFDGINIMALAMYVAGSPDPAKYVKDIVKVTSNLKGTPCTDYASCLALLKRGKAIFYNGAAGPHVFNEYHFTTGEWVVEVPGPTGRGSIVSRISNAELLKLSS